MKNVNRYLDAIREINVAPKERIKFIMEQLKRCPKVNLESFIDIEGVESKLHYLSVAFRAQQCVGYDVKAKGLDSYYVRQMYGYTIHTNTVYTNYYNHYQYHIDVCPKDGDKTLCLIVRTVVDKLPLKFFVNIFDSRIIEIQMEPQFHNLYGSYFIHGVDITSGKKLSSLLKRIVKENIPQLKEEVKNTLAKAKEEVERLKEML